MYVYLGNNENRFGASPGRINGYFTDANVHRVYRITWKFFSLTTHNVIIERLL